MIFKNHRYSLSKYLTQKMIYFPPTKSYCMYSEGTTYFLHIRHEKMFGYVSTKNWKMASKIGISQDDEHITRANTALSNSRLGNNGFSIFTRSQKRLLSFGLILVMTKAHFSKYDYENILYMSYFKIAAYFLLIHV